VKRIVITERQREVLANFELNESNDHEILVKKVVDDLNLNYEPIVGTYREGGEYFEKPIVKIKADGQTTTPKELLDYLKFKNKSIGEKMLKQILLDWVNGDIDDYTLTKNVSVS
jgi:hypothetical protein